MYPLPENCTVVVLVDEYGKVFNVATNIDPNIKVIVTQERGKFKDEALGQPFNVSYQEPK